MIRFVVGFFTAVLVAGQVMAASAIQEVKTPGGLTAWLVTEPSIPIISIEIGFKGGATLDPAGKDGLTYMMTGLLEEGTGDLDAAAFSRKEEELAAQFGYDTTRHSVSVSASVLKSNADEALDLLRRAITEPRFDEVAFARVKDQIKGIVARDQSDPDEIASAALNSLAYAGHPYAQRVKGTPETVEGITREDVIAQHKLAMAKDRLFIGVVGDVTAEELGPILDKLLGDLPETGASLAQKTSFNAPGGITVIDYESPQSVALWAQNGIERQDPDFFAAHIMNHILGGGSFSSRLYQEVREKRGLTYGISTFVAPMDYGEIMGGRVASANETVAEAIELVKAEWQRMAEEGVTDAELELAKKYITGNYALRWDGNSQIANILLGMQRSGLPRDYPLTRNDRMNAVTREDIARVAKRLLKADEIRFVVVGQPEGLTSTD